MKVANKSVYSISSNFKSKTKCFNLLKRIRRCDELYQTANSLQSVTNQDKEIIIIGQSLHPIHELRVEVIALSAQSFEMLPRHR